MDTVIKRTISSSTENEIYEPQTSSRIVGLTRSADVVEHPYIPNESLQFKLRSNNHNSLVPSRVR